MDKSLDDNELARRAAAGSMTAFEELVYRFEQRIFGFAFHSCRNRADASEITQDTFVRAFKALGQFDARYPFSCWLFSIVRRKCIDFHRSKRPPSDTEIPEMADSNDPAELVCREEDSRHIWSVAREKLPRVQFDILWLKYFEDMDVEQIARTMKKSRTHVKVLLFRARRVLARELKSASLKTRGPAAATQASVSPNIATI